MIVQVRKVSRAGVEYDALVFVCPGCIKFGGTGLHMLPVNTTAHSPSWSFDNDLVSPTLAPSILSRTGPDMADVCHSFMERGTLRFLSDCTHSLAGKTVSLDHLPDWVTD